MPPGDEGALAELLAPVPGRKVCFARTYDARHLRAHAKQKVTALLFQIRYYRHEPDQYYPQGQRNYYFDMAAKVKGRSKTLYTSGECVPHENGIGCGVDCDGGGVAIKRDDKSGGLLVSFPEARSRIRMKIGCDGDDEENTVDLTPGVDDKIFRLDTADLRACRALDRLY